MVMADGLLKLPPWGALCLLMSMSLLLAACGNSSDGTSAEHQEEPARTEESLELRQLRKELAELRRQHPASNCGESLFVNAAANCAFARNVEDVYYNEIGVGRGVIGPYNPRTDRDQRMHCVGKSVYKCTGDNAVVFFLHPAS
jgi:hypothetical protein